MVGHNSLRPQRGLETVAAERGIEVAFEFGGLGRPHAQQHERRAVALADHARAVRDVGFGRDRAGALDAGADRHLLQVDAEAGMAFLPAGLAVVTVVDADDREVRRVDHRDGRKRADAHEQIAVAGDHQHAFVGPRQR